MSNRVELTTDGRIGSVVCRRSYIESKTISYFCRNKSCPGTTGVEQDSHYKGSAFDILGKGHCDWMLAALVGIGTDCEYFRPAQFQTVRVLR